MTQPARFQFFRSSRVMLVLAGVVLLAFAASITVLSIDLERQIKNEREAQSDNWQWALSQIEVELIQLLLAADAVQHDVGQLNTVRLRFDVLYSRVRTLRVGSVFDELREQPVFQSSILRLSSFLDQQVPLIDGPDAGLLQGLGELERQGRAVVKDARAIGLSGVALITTMSDENRREVARTLTLAAELTAALVALLVALVIALLEVSRLKRRREVENLATLSRLDSIVSTTREAIVTVDSKGRIVDFNAAACQTLGYTRDQAVGADIAVVQVVQVEGDALFRPGLPPRVHDQGKVRVTARHQDGRIFPAELSISRVGEGETALFVAFLRDLSEQLAAEEALIAARDKAQAGEKAKADLLVVMSHEIRTPLNGMIGTIELMETTELQPEQREYLRIMQTSGQVLMQHVSDVLEIARLDSGKAPLTLVPVDLSTVIQEVMANQRPTCQANGNTILFVGPADGRTWVTCDKGLLQHILLNLIGNACKFTRDGTIQIDVTHLSDQGPTEILISDTGIGISQADLGRIFDDFVTLDATYARRSAGTGLGLGIVRRIVDQMGGTLTVQSQEGVGSQFRVSLPLQIIEEPPVVAAPDEAEPKRHLSVLVVEDNEFNRVIVRAMLQKEGVEVFEAHDGEEGITLANARTFDLIFMDISMPRVDGLQAAQAILTGNGASAHSPIVAMTAHALPEEAARFRKAGMERILVKPITRAMLTTVLDDFLEAGIGAEVVAKMLLCDDVFHELVQHLGEAKTKALAGRFLTETAAQVDMIVATLQRAKPDDEVFRVLHRIQGSAAMFGAKALGSYLSDIEAAWHEGQADEAERQLAALGLIWQNTQRAFHEAGVLPQASSLR